MAKSRCIPTDLFWDPDFCDLDSESQCVYIGLTLEADDYGRGLALVGHLARALNKPADTIVTALEHLEAAGLIIRYQAERYTYYQHARWDQWQRLDKRTPSKYPAPPSTDVPGVPGEIPGNPGKTPLEEEEELKKKRTGTEAEGEALPQNVTPFPGSGGSEDDKSVEQVTAEVASILRLPVTDALRRVVADFLPDATLSLTGQADLACEFIDNPERNSRHKAMSPGFYRQWLQREQKNPIASSQPPEKNRSARDATGTDGVTRSGLAARSLMHLGTEYQREVSSGTRQKGRQG